MRQGVLLLGVHLGGGPRLAVRHEDRVVAEAVGPPALPQQVPAHLALGDLSGVTRDDQHGGALERGPAALVGDVGDLGEHQVEVGRVVAAAGPTRAEDARHAVEGVDAQAAVVGDGGLAGGRRDRLGLEQGVGREGLPGLGDLGHVGVGVQPDELDGQPQPAEDLAELGDLVRVACGQDHPGHDRSASACRWVSSAQPPAARPSSRSSRARSNGSRSAVPCTSMYRPSPVITTFMSVSARTSSS